MPKRDKIVEDAAAPPGGVGTITIEADTVEEAMERLATEVGASAEILDARKVHRGGIGGFFAKERVQLTVRADEDTPPEAEGLAGVLDRMTHDAEAQEAEFATMLRHELGQERRDLGLDTFLEAVGWDARTSASQAEKTHTAVGEIAAAMNAPATPTEPAIVATEAAPAATTTTVTAPTPPPVSVPRSGVLVPAIATTQDEVMAEAARAGVIVGYPAAATQSSPEQSPAADADAWRTATAAGEPAGMGAVRWSTMELVRHGIPTEIVGAVAATDPCDDIAWIMGLAAAVAPLCAPLPSDIDTVMIGSQVAELAASLELTVVEPGSTAPYSGSFATPASRSDDDRDWLEFVTGTRRLHYVIGHDQSWRDDLTGTPAVVSWTDEHALVDALYLAVACDARLGYGVVPGSNATPVKVHPVDIALAIRAMMGRS